MGVIVVAALGVAIGLVLKQQIERRALDRSKQEARVIAQLGVQPTLEKGDLHYPIPLTRMNELDQQIGKQYFAETGVMRIKLFNRDAQIVFSDDRTLIGRHAVHADNVRKALAGDSVAELETGVNHDGTGERTLEVYVPVHVIGSDEPEGVLELYVSYGPVAADIREDVLIVDAAARRRAADPVRDAVPDRRRRLAAPAPPGRCTTR